MNSPSEIAENYIKIAKDKTESKWYKLLVLAVLAGAFIAFGGIIATVASSGAEGMQAALIKGAVFPVGLILVVVCGAELFTGNCLLISPLAERKIKAGAMLRNWGIVYAGNMIGGVIIAVLVAFTGLSGAVAQSVVATAAAKCNMNFLEALLRGILCNMLVCLAVWASMASKNVAGKALAVYLPIFGFVVCGFEHSVANMYYLTAGLIVNATTGAGAAGLTLGNALLFGLLPQTVGNIIGGGAIAMLYFVAYRTVGKKTVEPDAGGGQETKTND